jgi:nucleoside-diphosphate-sugar epimerase
MKVFVTGGTGFIGSHVIRQLVARGDDVYALTRSSRSATKAAGLGALPVRGNILDRETMRDGMRGSDRVMHIAGWYELGTDDVAGMERVNVEGARNVLELAHDLRVPRILHTSSIVVLGDTQGAIYDETNTRSGPFVAQNNRTKWEAHEKVARPLIDAGAPLVIAMPGAVYGPGDHSLIAALMQAYCRGYMPVVPGPNTTLSFVHVADAAEGLIRAADTGRLGASYLLTGQIATFAEIFALWAKLLNRRPPRLKIPASMLRPLVPVAGWLERRIPLPTLINHESLRTLGVTYAARSDKAQTELGWIPRPLPQGMAETLASMPCPTTAQLRRRALGIGVSLLALALIIHRLRQPTTKNR